MPAPAAVVGRYLEHVTRWPTARWDRGTTASVSGVALVVVAARVLIILVVLVTVPLAQPGLRSGHGPAVYVALVVSAVSFVVWIFAGNREHVRVPALAVTGIAGGVLAGLTPLSPAIAVGCLATSAAGVRLKLEASLAVTAATVAAYLAAGLAVGAPAEALVGYPLAYIGLWAFGLTRHAFLLRAEQAEQTLAETRRAHAAETQAAALAERARMAREIHDVLAHSLAAVSVNLQAAEGLLGALPAGSPELAKAIECVGRAEALTRDGLAEARRAILALRDDAVPLPEQLSSLAQEYRADGDVPVDFQVAGSPRPLAAEASLAAYRTAQEGLTNARKHAPGQPVRFWLQYSETEVAVHLTNPLPELRSASALAATGGGHGLTGLRERAALAGGTLTAGPAEGEWQVCLRIPA